MSDERRAKPTAGPSDPSDLSLYDLGRELFRISDELQKELEGGLAGRVPSLNTGDEPLLPDGNPLPPTEQCPRCGYWTAFPHFRKCPDPTQNGTAAEPPTESITDRNARIDEEIRNIELGREGEDPEGPAGGLDLGGSPGCAGGCPEED